MEEGHIVVLDVGKTLAKLTLWTKAGILVERRVRQNARICRNDENVLDVHGIENWLISTLYEFARIRRVESIIPVAHGAGIALIRNGCLATDPIDYEMPIIAADRDGYEQERDSFEKTGSPALPDGLNVGLQLHRQERLRPDLFDEHLTIVTWAQYWSWLLSGVATTEATSLGCHTDLWLPMASKPSDLASRRGWARRMAPLRKADSVLGTITAEWSDRTGLPKDVKIYCGIHDSNAALLAARGFSEIANNESTVLSTGTWFVAMRSPAPKTLVDLKKIPEARDCLVNIDAYGRPVPSARFMGGREIEILTGVDARRVDIKPDQPALVAAVPAVLRAGAMVLPTMAPGFGPFAHGRGRWLDMPIDPSERRAAVCLYAALVADAALDLIGARERILIEGRFAEAEVFVRGLATLRPNDKIFVSNAHNDVSYGALRLINPSLMPSAALEAIEPFDYDLLSYRNTWRSESERMEEAA